MPPKNESSGVPVEVRRGETDGLVHYGVISDGTFHTFASERQGDYDERVKAAAEAAESESEG